MGDEFAPKILEIVNEMRDELHHHQQQQRALRGEEAKAGALGGWKIVTALAAALLTALNIYAWFAR